MSELFNFDESFGKIVIGTDEAGRGPAAGGVFVACACFREKTETLIKELADLNDSKKLTRKKREAPDKHSERIAKRHETYLRSRYCKIRFERGREKRNTDAG